MTPATLEAIQAFAQFAGGALVGFVISTLTTYYNARTRVMESVLTEAEHNDIAAHRRYRARSDKVLPFVVVVVMIAMLLAGVSWIKSGQDDAENRRNDCIRAAGVAETLRDRTRNYLKGATAELKDDRADLRWKRDIARTLIQLGAGTNDALVKSTNRAISAQERSIEREADYIEHLENNPVPKASTEDC